MPENCVKSCRYRASAPRHGVFSAVSTHCPWADRQRLFVNSRQIMEFANLEFWRRPAFSRVRLSRTGLLLGAETHYLGQTAFGWAPQPTVHRRTPG